MKTILLLAALSLFGLIASAETCTKYCNPERSKPCGKGCITLDSNCSKSWATTCSGIRPGAAKAIYANPKHVDAAPESSK